MSGIERFLSTQLLRCIVTPAVHSGAESSSILAHYITICKLSKVVLVHKHSHYGLFSSSGVSRPGEACGEGEECRGVPSQTLCHM